MRFDHVGIVVRDVEQSARIWTELLGAEVLFRQPATGVDGAAFALPDDAAVRVVMLRYPGGSLELVEFLQPTNGTDDERRTCDRGISHLAFRIEPGEFDAIRAAWNPHVRWYGGVQQVTTGPASGCLWCYGMSADGVRVELTWRPAPIDGTSAGGT